MSETNGNTANSNLAEQWKRQRGFVVELPSGKTIRMVRTLDIMAGLKAGTVPNPLRTTLSEMIEEGRQLMNKEERANPELIIQMGALVDETVSRAVIDPKIYLVPEGENPALWNPDDEFGISIVDLDQMDKTFIYSVAQGGATDLQAFREQQEKFVADLVDGAEVRVPTKRASRSKK